MGSTLSRILDPNLPDVSIRDLAWHVDGVIVDAALTNSVISDDRLSTNLEVGDEHHLSNGIATRSRRRSRGFAPKFGSVQKCPPGVLFVYEGSLHYRSRRLLHCYSVATRHLRINVCDILDVNSYDHFTSQKNGRIFSAKVVDIHVLDSEGSSSNAVHIGFLSKNSEQITRQLKETLSKHRQKPRIFQFNSFDVEGVEIEVP